MTNKVTDRIVLLGTKGGPSLRKNGPNPSSSLLQLAGHTCVIDCGIGVTRSLVDADVPLTQIDAIFITHLHCDHLLELGPLIYTAWASGLTSKLSVYGPLGIEEYWAGFLQSMSFDHSIRIADDKRQPLSELVDIHTYSEGQVANLGELSISACQVDHPPVEMCFALRFDTPDSSVAFSADTCFFPPLAKFAQGADVLVHEAMLGAGIDELVERIKGAPGLRDHLVASHTMVEDVGQIATQANVEHLVLNHLVPADSPNFTDDDWRAALKNTWDGALSIGKDGMTIPLNSKLTTNDN